MRSARLIGMVLTIGAVVHSSPLRAEVMDKEATLGEVWAWSIAGAVVGFALSRLRWWLLLVSLPLTLFMPLGPVLECHDEFVGPAIRKEAGADYVFQAHAAFLLVLVGNAAGAALSLRARAASGPATSAGTGA